MRSDANWDYRTCAVAVPCIGGPLDGDTISVAPGMRTVRMSGWAAGCYYEVMVVRGEYRMVWHTPTAMLFSALTPEAPDA